MTVNVSLHNVENLTLPDQGHWLHIHDADENKVTLFMDRARANAMKAAFEHPIRYGEVDELLDELAEWFDRFADVHDSEDGPEPNPAMRLLARIRDLAGG